MCTRIITLLVQMCSLNCTGYMAKGGPSTPRAGFVLGITLSPPSTACGLLLQYIKQSVIMKS
ncbi:hypothetical protein CFIMG_002516RA [Ceratocystis fimbriata CBS 114723]|uniref:Uncharacterized protein n=1 Tax=Ceratocystis fimbriata CBS 114723 TaxID=1035309 RepID=A0A2C5WZY3_9PEZI|nr:hypothetical protein CFIMG_002516RA [Ceratocystis fimbriata CBS 114723]